MLHACFYTICLVFRYTSWHFYAFSGTNLLTRCHSAPCFLLFLCFKKVIHEIFSELDETKARRPDISRSFQNTEGEMERSHWWATPQGAQPGAGPRPPVVSPTRSTFDAAPLPIKTPRREKPKDPITFPEHIVIRRRCRPEDREGPEALPSTLPERGIAIGGLFHRHACLRCDEWVVYLGLWVHSSSYTTRERVFNDKKCGR
jgi:hypothetical protein